jgi:hypothetical protein
MTRFEIRQLISGGMITNYFCTSACRHCLYNCRPDREKQYITPETAEENLRIMRDMGCTSIHIGGGEPMLRPDELGEVLERSARAGVFVEYVETNASWFKDMASAVTLLSAMRRKGLRTILVSISPFHNEFVPFSRTNGVMEAARRAGIGVFPWITDFIGDLSEFDADRTHPLEKFEQRFGAHYLNRVLKRYWIHMGGRALDTFRPILPNHAPEKILKENPRGCAAELANTTHFHMDLFGNYIPGLCSGLSISTKDLGQPLSEKKYPLITTLSRSGIRGLFERAQNVLGYTPKRNGYINKCDMCTEIRTSFVHHRVEEDTELQPKEFYNR